MTRPPRRRRPALAPRFESLEGRSLLTAAAVSGPWALGNAAEVLVGFQAGLDAAAAGRALAPVGGLVETLRDGGASLVALAPWADTTSALAALGASPGVRYAVPNAAIHAEAYAVSPNDPKYPLEYGLNLIDAPYAWSITTGNPAIVVAVLDSGLDMTNPDLSSKVWTNGDTSGADGYRGDLHGWNFVSGTSNIQDNNGHGSHVSGVIAAASNNAYGMTGVDWNARIMPVKVLDSSGNGSTDNAVSGIYFAVNHGAKVINASWGGTEYSPAFIDALNYANAHGVVFVTAAGNDGQNNDLVPTYPASYRTPNELVVGAVDQSGNLAGFSNIGPRTVDVAAPGVNIYSTVLHGYASYTGTSMATAYVSGTVALLAGQFPTMTAADLAARVRDTAKPLPTLKGTSLTGGLVDPYYALIGQTRGGTASASGGIDVRSAPTVVAGATRAEEVGVAILAGDAVYKLRGGTNQAFVAATYQAVFGRAPSDDEVAFNVNALNNGAETRFSFVRALQGSSEGLYTRVARWYSEELGRADDLDTLKSDSGVRYWSAALASGRSDNDVRVAILASDGVYRLEGGTPNTYVQGLYRALFGREAGPDEVNYNAARLLNGLNRTDLVRQLLDSVEGRRTDTAHFYAQQLGRTEPLASLKDDSGVIYWANDLGDV